MRATVDPSGNISVTLSRRNLQTLLLKLDEPTSYRTIMRRQGGDNPVLIVEAEDDEEHYAEREAGKMHPREEARL